MYVTKQKKKKRKSSKCERSKIVLNIFFNKTIFDFDKNKFSI